MSIVNLQETSANSWKAMYHGNYGIYTIKIKTDGEKTVDFSCTCPSDYYPCKHIRMIEEAIRERVSKKLQHNKQEMDIEHLLKDVPHKKLSDFLIKQSRYNPQLKNEILLEFTQEMSKQKIGTAVNYKQILNDALTGLYFDYENCYGYDNGYGHNDNCIEIEVIDQWLDKAREYVELGNPNEALSICKACIEEYAAWCNDQEDYIIDNVSYEYSEGPFNILLKIILMNGVDKNDLLNYCKLEMLKPKYKYCGMYDGFDSLFLKLSIMTGADDYIALQNRLLHELGNNNSPEAKILFKQKIDFYRNNNQEEKAWDIIKENLQIESFRGEWVKKLITENKLKEAKKQIHDFTSKPENENKYLDSWEELRLQIAQIEKDIPEIRRVSFKYIENRFEKKYYEIYKSTFTTDEWIEKMEKLIKHYEKHYDSRWFHSSIAKVLQAEKQEERLMKYIEKHLSVDCLEQYYVCFSSSYPEKTLTLFRTAIDQYIQNNTGRTYYEHIVRLFDKMIQIDGGSNLVREMITQYRLLYKNRSAMMEIINKFRNEIEKIQVWKY